MKKILTIFVIVLIAFSATFGFFVAVAIKLALFDVFLSLTPSDPLLANTNILVLGIDDAEFF